MTDTRPQRKTQAQRRAESSQAVLDSAVRLFGEKGYADTSLEDIATDCGLTIRPIYHYFGNKKALFMAVNELMEARILASMKVGDNASQGEGFLANWHAYLELCDDPGFRQIVLVDSPNILGRERWTTSPVYEKARRALQAAESLEAGSAFRGALINRIVMAAFTEAAMMVAEAGDIESAKSDAEALMAQLYSALLKPRTITG